jgi:hypothetical protein
MGKFAKFLGKVSIKVGGETIDLNKISVEDVQKLVDLSKKKENELVYGVKVISDIVSKSYPEEPREEVESFVLKNYTQLTEEIIIALGWTTREKLEKEKAKATEKKMGE